jgi:hypothetical protein
MKYKKIAICRAFLPKKNFFLTHPTHTRPLYPLGPHGHLHELPAPTEPTRRTPLRSAAGPPVAAWRSTMPSRTLCASLCRRRPNESSPPMKLELPAAVPAASDSSRFPFASNAGEHSYELPSTSSFRSEPHPSPRPPPPSATRTPGAPVRLLSVPGWR